MRETIGKQMTLGQTAIQDIKLDLKSQDDIPQVLRGLQHIYCNKDLREEVFLMLEDIIPAGVNKSTGRPGMDLWKLFVMGVLRLNLNHDYNRIHELVNNHIKIREILGHGGLNDDYMYRLQTIKDNVSLLTAEVLDRINQAIVKSGHKLIKVLLGSKDNTDDDVALKGRCDSFVVETDVHYPTDTNLLYDAIRTVIRLIALSCFLVGFSKGLLDWSESVMHIRKVKSFLRKIQKLRKSNSKNEKKKQACEEEIVKLHQEYINLVNFYLMAAKETLNALQVSYGVSQNKVTEILRFIGYAEKQIDLIERRVMKGESIPHCEKICSVFEEHTEWISKGKAGVPVELGLRVCVMEDQYGFILHQKVMEKETDDKVAVSIVEETKTRFSSFVGCSFDKGFYTPDNRVNLDKKLGSLIMPKKGRLNNKDKEIEHSEDFIDAKRQHAAVESAINALEVHGLDRCPDHGIERFKTYVALAVVGRNIQKLGATIRQDERKAEQAKVEGNRKAA